MTDKHVSNDPWKKRLLELDSGLLSDVLDEAGCLHRVLCAKITSIGSARKIAGPIVPVSGSKTVKGAHASPPMSAAQLEKGMAPGAVMVLSSGSMLEAAPMGGIVSRSLLNHGCAGIVTDSAVRDCDEIEEIGLPVYAAGVSPVNAARIWQFNAVNVPIVMPTIDGGSLIIQPGDYILADRDGTVVIPAAVIGQIVEDAERLKEIEAEIVGLISNGTSRAEAFKRFPRFKHVRAIK